MNLRKIVSVVLFVSLLITLFPRNSMAKEVDTITITDCNYNTNDATWDFTLDSSNNRDIYYIYKDNEVLSIDSKKILDGGIVKIPASLIKDCYKYLKVCTYNKGKQSSVNIFNISNISRNTYINDLTEFCGRLINQNDSQYNKIKKFYRWIGETCSYKFDGLTNTEYNAFYGKVANCSGYSRLFKDMCMIVGVKCDYINSQTIADYNYKEWHAWNHVELDGKLYLVDCGYSGISNNNQVDYSHFCNNAVVNYVVTDKYDLSSKNSFE